MRSLGLRSWRTQDLSLFPFEPSCLYFCSGKHNYLYLFLYLFVLDLLSDLCHVWHMVAFLWIYYWMNKIKLSFKWNKVNFFFLPCVWISKVIFPTALFSVMCYNVLCDKYATRQLYGYCPSWALNWDYRKKAIIQEILSCNADIISLQVSHQKNSCLNCRNAPWSSKE